MASNHTKDPTKKYLPEVVAAVVVVYFLLGGHAWSPATWALFAIVGIWIVLKNVRRETGFESEEKYNRWSALIGLLVVIALVASPLWTGSWWTLLLGLVVGAFWLDDRRLEKKSSAG